jgi:hypothetical protein
LRRGVTFQVLRSSEGQGPRATAGLKARGEGSPPRGGAGRSRRGSEAADEVESLPLGSEEVSPGAGGCWSPGSRVRSRRLLGGGGEGAVRGLRSGRVEDPRSGRELWRGENPGEQRPEDRGNPDLRERIHGGIRASRRVKLAERAAVSLGVRGDREAGLGTRKGSSSPGGSLATAPRGVGVGGNRGGWLREARSSRPVDNREGAVASRGDHDLREGKALKGGTQERLRHETGPWNTSRAGKPLRG